MTSDEEFREAVSKQIKTCKTDAEIGKRSFELMKIVADVSWEAKAVMDTDKEVKGLSK